MARVRLLGTEELPPGGEGWLQLELRDPLVAVRGDRYILRRPSPGETLGGGAIMDPQPKGRHKRFDEQVLRSLASLAQGSPADVLMEAALTLGAAPIKDMVLRSRLEPRQAGSALTELLEAGGLVALEPGEPAANSDLLAMAGPQWAGLHSRILQTLEEYHKQYPLRLAMPREELKSRLEIGARLFGAAIRKLAAEDALTESGSAVARAGHSVKFSAGQQEKVRALMRRFARAPYSPPGMQECRGEAGPEVVEALLGLGQLVAVSDEVLFRKEDYDSILLQVRGFIREHGRISVAEARDLFNSSRKFMLALLEHLDAIGMTSRDGDFRRLRE
jgi:selenocysteine-specific elongation factor